MRAIKHPTRTELPTAPQATDLAGALHQRLLWVVTTRWPPRPEGPQSAAQLPVRRGGRRPTITRRRPGVVRFADRAGPEPSDQRRRLLPEAVGQRLPLRAPTPNGSPASLQTSGKLEPGLLYSGRYGLGLAPRCLAGPRNRLNSNCLTPVCLHAPDHAGILVTVPCPVQPRVGAYGRSSGGRCET